VTPATAQVAFNLPDAVLGEVEDDGSVSVRLFVPIEVEQLIDQRPDAALLRPNFGMLGVHDKDL
jgi:hypothetical protein